MAFWLKRQPDPTRPISDLPNGKRIDTVNEKQKALITEVFTDEFIQRHSQYKSLQEMVKVSGVGEIENVLTPPFAIFCTYMTDFHSWDAMREAAKAEYFQRKRISQQKSDNAG